MDLKIIYIGCVKFSAEILKEIISLGLKPNLVITKSNSTFNSDFFDLSQICSDNKLSSIYTHNINSEETTKKIREIKPDLIFCFGWSSLIKKQILDIPKIGTLGFHPALLPKNKGRHPIIWSLALGLKVTGSTFFFMDEGADTGDIISQKKININENDDAKTLYDKIIETAKIQISEILNAFLSKSYVRIKQHSNTGNYWRKRSKADGKIDFRMTTKSICNLVKALTKPYPGAHFEFQNKDFKVWIVKEGRLFNNNIEPGKIMAIDGSKINVKTGDGSIWIIKHELKELPELNNYLL